MITYHTCRGPQEERQADLSSVSLPDGALWIDIKDPQPDEIAFLERATGLEFPTFEQLAEVEASSRLRQVGEALYLSVPVVFRGEAGVSRISPLGLILSADHLVTIRYADLKSFEAYRTELTKHPLSEPTTIAVFVGLLEAVVDRLADLLESVGADLDGVADRIFGAGVPGEGAGTAKAQDRMLRLLLRRLGQDRQLISKVRATLLGLDRMVPYVEGQGETWLPDGAKSRLSTLRRDLASLDEFEARLSDKIQFMLDATLGLISIEQNDTFRILTIVSVVGIPPTLVASMYGMNFKFMPELNWEYGYAYGLCLILFSAVAPLVYFRRKGWL